LLYSLRGRTGFGKTRRLLNVRPAFAPVLVERPDYSSMNSSTAWLKLYLPCRLRSRQMTVKGLLILLFDWLSSSYRSGSIRLEISRITRILRSLVGLKAQHSLRFLAAGRRATRSGPKPSPRTGLSFALSGLPKPRAYRQSLRFMPVRVNSAMDLSLPSRTAFRRSRLFYYVRWDLLREPARYGYPSASRT